MVNMHKWLLHKYVYHYLINKIRMQICMPRTEHKFCYHDNKFNLLTYLSLYLHISAVVT